MLTNSKLVHHSHDHRRCINAALARANDLCDAENHRLTPTRESVLRLLWQSHRPMGSLSASGPAGENLRQTYSPTDNLPGH